MLKEFLSDHSRKNEFLKETYRQIHKRKLISKAELIEILQARSTTMTRALEELLQKGWIKEGGVGLSSGGRPPILYEAEKNAAWMIGIDISRTETRAVLTTVGYTIVEHHQMEMTDNHTPDVVFEELHHVIEKWLDKYGISYGQLLGIGVGTVGPVLRTEGRMRNPESFLSSGWENVAVREKLARFPVRILVDNGANSAAVAEFVRHNETFSHILYCINGYGIRGGVVNHGKVFTAGQGDTSALGHIIVQANGKVCTCGHEGCLAAYTSYPAMMKEYERVSGEKNVSLNRFLSRIQEGNQEAIGIAKKGAFYYGVGLANMINALRPELVVLHGHLVYETPFFYTEAVQHAVAHLYMPEKGSAPVFKKGTLKEEAIALGAAIQVFQSYFPY